MASSDSQASVLPRLLASTAIGLVLACAEGGRADAADDNGTLALPTLSVDAPPVTVNPDYKVSQPSLNKLTEPLRDTAQTIDAVPKQMLDDRGVTNFADAVRTVPGVTLQAGEAGQQGNNLSIRGFNARGDIFLDGMRDFGSYYRDPFNYDEIEVLKGPSSILFGRGSTGGVINQVGKTPLLDPFTQGSFSFGTDATKRATIDFNQPLPELGSGSAFRINLMGNDSGVAGRDVAENRRFGIAPSFVWGLGTPTRVTLSYFHQTEDDIPDYGIPIYFGVPAPVNRSNYYGFANGANFFHADADIGTAKIEHDINDVFSVRDQLRYAQYQRNIQVTEAQIPATVTRFTPLSSIQVVRNQIATRSTETDLDNQSDLTAKFRTGPVQHTVVTGVEATRETSDPTRLTWTGVPGTSLLSPDPNQAFAGTASLRSLTSVVSTSVGIYALDTLKLGEHWEFTGGWRWDDFNTDFREAVAALHLARDDQMPSWRAALSYKPTHEGMVYFSAGTSFDPSAEQASLSAATVVVAPEKNRSYEVGSKWDLFGDDLLLSGAVFRTEKLNAREASPIDPTIDILAGNERVDGFELQAVGRITEAWQVSAGYAFMEGKVISSPNALEAGNPIPNTPKNSFSVWTTYETPWNTQVGGGVNYVASRTTATTPNATTGLFTRVPGYATVDLMAKYHLTEHIDVQANLTNLFDKYYIDELHPSHIVPGAGRTLLFSVNYRY